MDLGPVLSSCQRPGLVQLKERRMTHLSRSEQLDMLAAVWITLTVPLWYLASSREYMLRQLGKKFRGRYCKHGCSRLDSGRMDLLPT